MLAHSYPCQVTQCSPGEWLVTFPDIPQAVAGAPTESEALALAPDALEAAIEAYLDHGERLPEPRIADEGEVDVAVTPILAARAMLHEVMRRCGLTEIALARLMGRDETTARRAYTGRGASLELILDALQATGQRPVLTHDLVDVDGLATEIKVAADELWYRVADRGAEPGDLAEALAPYILRAGTAQPAAMRAGVGLEWEQVRHALLAASQVGPRAAFKMLGDTVDAYQHAAYPSAAYYGCRRSSGAELPSCQ